MRIFKRPGVTRRKFVSGEWVETRSTGEEVVLEIPGSALDGMSLRRSDLVGANLAGLSLRGADLTEAILTGCDLSKADLTGASLRRTLLAPTNLSNACLHAADLRGARFYGATLQGADLTDAMLEGAVFLRIRADSSTRWPGGNPPPHTTFYQERTDGGVGKKPAGE
jgi:hypothetical protein